MAQQRQSNRPASMRFITRLDYERSKGGSVRVSAQSKNLASQLFSDRVHGGQRKALAAAKQWRDEQVALHGIHATPDGGWAHSRDTRNTSRIVGVSLHIDRRRKPPTHHWRAEWPTGCRSLSVKVFGYAEEFQLALEARCEGIGVPIPDVKPPSMKTMLK